MGHEIVRLKKEEAVLVAIDFQTKLVPAMHESEKLEETMVKLAKGLAAFNIPKVVTQQYTKGLGPTVENIAEALGAFEPIDKTRFSAYGDENFREALESTGRKTVILAGIEAHICVEQTALDLLENGYEVFAVADCIQSRNPQNREIALKRMHKAGVVVTSFESVLYELLGGAKEPEFKTISALVK